MTQNRSHAVMSQRSEPHDSLDDFPTPPWAGRALCEYVISERDRSSFLEPACNRGYLIRGLTDYFDGYVAFDIHDYGDNSVEDFLFPGIHRKIPWVITNPPFRLAEQFAQRAFECAYEGVALLVRTQFLEGVGRHQRLFCDQRPQIIAQFSERVPMVKGRCDPKASTATSYCWLVWFKDNFVLNQTRFQWIPPCRKQLERPGDYA